MVFWYTVLAQSNQKKTKKRKHGKTRESSIGNHCNRKDAESAEKRNSLSHFPTFSCLFLCLFCVILWLMSFQSAIRRMTKNGRFIYVQQHYLLQQNRPFEKIWQDSPSILFSEVLLFLAVFGFPH